MKASRILGLLLIVIELTSVALFLVCGQTIFGLLGTMTGGGGRDSLNIDQSTQIATLTFTFTPKNSGMIDANVDVGFGITLSDGSYSTKNTTTIYLPPGAQKNVDLTIRVPQDKLQLYADGKGTLDILTSIKTLNGLVRMDYNARTEGGG